MAVGIAMAVVTAVWLPNTTNAADQVKGAQKLMELKPIKTAQDLEALEPGDMLTMSCPKCKNVTISYVEKAVKRGDAATKLAVKHLCPGCETTIKSEGSGKAAKDVVKHVCTKCGSKDVFCCVLKKGSDPTKGMEYFNLCIKDNPKEPRGYYGMGYCYKEKGDIANAEAMFKKALEADPQYENAVIELNELDRIKKVGK